MASLTGTPVTGEFNSGALTLSVTVPSDATKLLIFAAGTKFPTETISSAVFNTSENLGVVSGAQPRAQTGGSNYVMADFWQLDAPTSTTADLDITLSGSMRGGAVAFCLSDAAAGAPADVDIVEDDDPSSGSVSATSDSTSTGIVLFGAACDDADNTTGALSSGTEIANFIAGTGTGQATRIVVGWQAGTGSPVAETVTWTGPELCGVGASIAISSSGAPTVLIPVRRPR